MGSFTGCPGGSATEWYSTYLKHEVGPAGRVAVVGVGFLMRSMVRPTRLLGLPESSLSMRLLSIRVLQKNTDMEVMMT
jgi:hypothetical protein